MGKLTRLVLPGDTETLKVGGQARFKLGFLDPARAMTAPYIESLVWHFKGTVDTDGTAGLAAQQFSHLLTRLFVSSAGLGDIINLRGSSVRLKQITEHGQGYKDPTAIAISQTGAAVEFSLVTDFGLPRGASSRDGLLGLAELLEGGQINCQMAASIPGNTHVTLHDFTVDLTAMVVDLGTPQASMRVVWQDQNLISFNTNYDLVGGDVSLRACYFYIGETNENTPTKWATQTITSNSLRISALDAMRLIDLYRVRQRFPNANDPILQTAASNTTPGFVIPLLFPLEDQQLSDMPDITKLHVQSNAGGSIPSDAQLITCQIIDRPVASEVRSLGRAAGGYNANLVQHAIATRGRIPSARHGDVVAHGVASHIARRAPVRLADPTVAKNANK